MNKLIKIGLLILLGDMVASFFEAIYRANELQEFIKGSSPLIPMALGVAGIIGAILIVAGLIQIVRKYTIGKYHQ